LCISADPTGMPIGMEGTTRFKGTDDDQSVGELVQQLSQQTAALVRQEMRLATVELQQKGKKAGIGAGMFGGAGVVALYGGGALIAAAVLGIATFLEPWMAAVIVGVVLLAVAGILALTGKKQVEQAGPPVPEEAVESAKRDVDEVKRARARA
jgi:membrane protein